MRKAIITMVIVLATATVARSQFAAVGIDSRYDVDIEDGTYIVEGVAAGDTICLDFSKHPMKGALVYVSTGNSYTLMGGNKWRMYATDRETDIYLLFCSRDARPSPGTRPGQYTGTLASSDNIVLVENNVAFTLLPSGRGKAVALHIRILPEE